MPRTKCETFLDIPNTHYQIGCFGNIRNKNNGRIKVPTLTLASVLNLKNAKHLLKRSA